MPVIYGRCRQSEEVKGTSQPTFVPLPWIFSYLTAGNSLSYWQSSHVSGGFCPTGNLFTKFSLAFALINREFRSHYVQGVFLYHKNFISKVSADRICMYKSFLGVCSESRICFLTKLLFHRCRKSLSPPLRGIFSNLGSQMIRLYFRFPLLNI